MSTTTKQIVKKESKKLTAKQIAEAQAKKLALKEKRANSHYGINCLNNHAKAKAEAKTIGFCIKFYLATENTENQISELMLNYLKEVNKNSELYKKASNEVRKTKKGFFTPFYFLQWCTKQTKTEVKK